mgnify:CR=1 FL=1
MVERLLRLALVGVLVGGFAGVAFGQPGGDRGGVGVGGSGEGGGVLERVESRAGAALDEAGEGAWVRTLVTRSADAYEAGRYVESAALARAAWRLGGDRAGAGDRGEPPMEAAYNEGLALLALDEVEAAAGRLRVVRAMRAEGGYERGIVADATYALGLIELAGADAAAEARSGSRDPLFGVLLGDAEEGWGEYEALMGELIGHYLRAAGLFEEVMASSPGDGDASRNYQIARLRAGELQRARYEAWEERREIMERIVRPDEAMRALERLAVSQGDLAGATESAVGGGDGDGDGGLFAMDQEPVTAETGSLFDRAAVTRELLDGRLGEPVPAETLCVLRTRYEEAERGWWDAVEGQRWAALELEGGDLGEGARLQRQAERDLREILERLRTQTPPPPPPQGGEGEGEPQPSEGERDPRDSGEEREPPEVDDGATDFEEERLARETAERLRQIFEREELDKERVRRMRGGRTGGVEKDW